MFVKRQKQNLIAHTEKSETVIYSDWKSSVDKTENDDKPRFEQSWSLCWKIVQ